MKWIQMKCIDLVLSEAGCSVEIGDVFEAAAGPELSAALNVDRPMLSGV